MKKMMLFLLLGATLQLQAQTGCFSGNCTDGQGSFRWDNGDVYAGAWVNGNRTGYGRYDWSDGGYYVGYFKDGMLHGEGAYYAADGTSMVGQFDMGNYVGATAVEDYSDLDDLDTSTAWMNDMLAKLEESEAAEKAAMEKASKKDFCYVLTEAVKGFPNNMKNLQGEQAVDFFGGTVSWYSNTIVKGSLTGSVYEAWDSPYNTWYNVLGSRATKEEAMNLYMEYQKMLSNCSLPAVTLVSEQVVSTEEDEYEYVVMYYFVDQVSDTANELAYRNMYIEIEMYETVMGDGWEVTIRVRGLPTEE